MGLRIVIRIVIRIVGDTLCGFRRAGINSDSGVHMILNNSGQKSRAKPVRKFKTPPKERREFWLDRSQDGWTIGTNIYQYVHLLAAKCYRNGWEIVKGTTGNTYYFKVPLSEATVHLKIFEQTATEGRKRWGKELGSKHGVAALRKYAVQRKIWTRGALSV